VNAGRWFLSRPITARSRRGGCSRPRWSAQKSIPLPRRGVWKKAFNIHMQQLTRPVPFIPYHRPGRSFEGFAGQRVAFPQTRHPVAAEDVADRPLRHPRKHRQPSGPRPQQPPRSQHPLFHRRAGTHGGTLQPRRPILQTGLAFLPVAAHPLGHALPGHAHTAEPPALPARPLLPTTPSLNVPKATTSRYHASLKTSSRAIGFFSLPITPGGLHLCNNQNRHQHPGQVQLTSIYSNSPGLSRSYRNHPLGAGFERLAGQRVAFHRRNTPCIPEDLLPCYRALFTPHNIRRSSLMQQPNRHQRPGQVQLTPGCWSAALPDWGAFFGESARALLRVFGGQHPLVGLHFPGAHQRQPVPYV